MNRMWRQIVNIFHFPPGDDLQSSWNFFNKSCTSKIPQKNSEKLILLHHQHFWLFIEIKIYEMFVICAGADNEILLGLWLTVKGWEWADKDDNNKVAER